MANCSAIANAPASTALIKYLSSIHVNDKNGDGEIDLAQEVFAPDKDKVVRAALTSSDINGDGKLVGAEIRYFLNFALGTKYYIDRGPVAVNGSVKRDNPLTEADLDYLICSVNKEDNPIILKNLAEAMSRAGVDKKKVANTFQLAIDRSKGTFTATTDLSEIAMAMYRSDMNKDKVAAAIRLLIAIAGHIDMYDSVGRGQGWLEAEKVLTQVPNLGEQRLASLHQALNEMAKSMSSDDKRSAQALLKAFGAK
jgi:hypothetical protein